MSYVNETAQSVLFEEFIDGFIRNQKIKGAQNEGVKAYLMLRAIKRGVTGMYHTLAQSATTVTLEKLQARLTILKAHCVQDLLEYIDDINLT